MQLATAHACDVTQPLSFVSTTGVIYLCFVENNKRYLMFDLCDNIMSAAWILRRAMCLGKITKARCVLFVNRTRYCGFDDFDDFQLSILDEQNYVQ